MSIWSSRWLRWVISLGLLTAVIWLADLHAIWNELRGVDLRWVLAALGFALLDRFVLTYRWQMLLVIRKHLLGFYRLLRIQLAANFLGSFLPSSIGVDAIRIAALSRAGLPAMEVIATTLVDRATLVIATLLFGSLTILGLASARLPPDLSRMVLLATFIVVAGCLAVLLPSVRRWARGSVFPRLPDGIRMHSSEVAVAMLSYRHEPRRLLQVAFVTIVLFIVRLCFAKSLALACGADVSFGDLLLVIPILWIVVMLPITIGNIGLQDAGYVALMGLLGVPAAVAFSMSLIEHVLARAVSLPGALFLADITGSVDSNGRPGDNTDRRHVAPK